MRNLKPKKPKEEGEIVLSIDFFRLLFSYLCSGSETEASSVNHAVNHRSLKETKLFPVSEQDGTESQARNMPQNISIPLRNDTKNRLKTQVSV